jgi:hypothetical protein
LNISTGQYGKNERWNIENEKVFGMQNEVTEERVLFLSFP